VRKNPFPAAAIIPVGPFQLSIQPATGSRQEDNTEKRKTFISFDLFLEYSTTVMQWQKLTYS
jgi:hypothetical protein